MKVMVTEIYLERNSGMPLIIITLLFHVNTYMCSYADITRISRFLFADVLLCRHYQNFNIFVCRCALMQTLPEFQDFCSQMCSYADITRISRFLFADVLLCRYYQNFHDMCFFEVQQ